MAIIVIIEDEKLINELIRRNLSLVGHKCFQAYSGEEALQIVEKEAIDLAILDIMLPKMNGWDLMKHLDMPVIILTALGDLTQRLHGLNLGADDYIVKPFETLELLARVTAVLRRTRKLDTSFSIDNVTVDFSSRIVNYANCSIDLTPQEFELLETLIANRNIALSREKLLELAWGYDFCGDTRTVDVHIQKLRKKLGWEDRIRTIYKIGYRLET